MRKCANGGLRGAVWAPTHDSNLALALVASSVAGGGFTTVTPSGEELVATHLNFVGE